MTYKIILLRSEGSPMLKKSLLVSIPICGILLWSFVRAKNDENTTEPDVKPSQSTDSFAKTPKISAPQGVSSKNKTEKINTAVDAGNLSNEGQAVAKLSASLSNSETSMHAEILSQALADNEISRLNVLYAAAQYNSEELLGFWDDVLTRKIPINEDEANALRLDEPNLTASMASAEVSIALDQLRILAPDSENARRILVSTVNTKGGTVYELALRENAFRALQEVDLRQALQLLKEMDPKDALISYLVRER